MGTHPHGQRACFSSIRSWRTLWALNPSVTPLNASNPVPTSLVTLKTPFDWPRWPRFELWLAHRENYVRIPVKLTKLHRFSLSFHWLSKKRYKKAGFPIMDGETLGFDATIPAQACVKCGFSLTESGSWGGSGDWVKRITLRLIHALWQSAKDHITTSTTSRLTTSRLSRLYDF